MRLTPSHPVIDIRADKEVKLKSFIAAALSQHHTAPVTLVVRGTDSPIAMALMAVLTESQRADIAVQVVLFDVDAIIEDYATTSVLDLRNAEYRVLHDARFASAHEQLVLDESHAWVGDCMRRDPSKRDAFEMYHADAVNTAHATRSFAKLWATAKPLRRSVACAPAAEVIAAGQASDQAELPTTN